MRKKFTVLVIGLLICIGTYAQYNETQNQYHLKVTAGASYERLSMDFSHVDNEPGIGGSLGLEGEYMLPFNKNKWSFVLGLDFHMLTISDSPQYNDRLLSMNYAAIEVPFGVRHYIFLNEKTSLFLNAFLKVNLLLDKKGVIDFEPNFGLDDLDQAGGSMNFAWGIGLSMKKFAIEARMESYQNLLKKYIIYRTELNRISVIFSYKLF